MKQRSIWTVILLVVVLVMVVASCKSATAPTPSPTPPTPMPEPAPPTPEPVLPTLPASTLSQIQGISGTLTKIDNNTLTLTTDQGPVTVNVGSDTTVGKITTGTLSDLHEGQSLTVTSTQDAKGNVITIIIIRPQDQGTLPTPPAGATRRGVSGTITKIDGDTLTLTTDQGPVTVNVSSDTTVGKITTGALSDLREGQSLTAIGSKDANGNVTAISITIWQ